VDPKPGPIPTRVRALEDRIACEITFPRVAGYRYDLPGETVNPRFTADSKLTLSTEDVPTRVENAPIVGEISIHTLDDLKRRREQEVAFLLAKLTLEKYFRDETEERPAKDAKGREKGTVVSRDFACLAGASSPSVTGVRHWLFPQLVEIAREWMGTCLKCKDNTFPQMLLFVEIAHDASDRIYHSVVASHEGEKAIKPILEPYNTTGSTRYVDFDTTRPVYATNPRYCHVSHVVADTKSWEQKMAQALEELGDEGIVLSYVKNQNLNFQIPYTINGEEHRYMPDFLVRLDDGHGPEDPLHLIIEVTGEKDKDKAAKVSTARNLWVPAVNNHGGFGRWDFMEIDDPWNAKTALKTHLGESRGRSREASARKAD
jgi:type III restriction enzyme